MSLATEIAGKLNYLNGQDKNMINALAPYSGYMAWKENNFYFNTSSSFLASIADNNRYVKFGDKVVDTYSEEMGIFTGNNAVVTQNLNTINITTTATNGTAKATIETDGHKGIYKIKYKVTEATSTIRRYWDGGYNILSVGVEYEEYLISDGNTVLEFLLLASAGASAKISNISVKEIQTKSATDYIPEVIVQDQATYGLTTQSSVNAGDYVVVDRKELVTNGTFDSDISGWTGINSTLSLESNTLKITNISTGRAYQTFDTIAGQKYILEWTYAGGTVAGAIDTASGINYVIDSYKQTTSIAGTTQFYTFIAESSQTTLILCTTLPTVGAYAEFDNISVKQLDEVYRAKTDVPSGTLLTNTTYFEVRDNLPISNQIAFLHTMDSTTKAYEGISNEILFNDALAIETPKAIMLKNGFSEVSKGLYSKGSKLYVFAGYWQTLNKGAYHPVFNMAGTRGIKRDGVPNDSRTWYATGGMAIDNVSHSFSRVSDSTTYATGSCLQANGNLAYGSNGYVPSRPDSKFYNIIYQDQFISFNHSELAYKPTDSEKKRIREYEKYRGVEGSVATVTAGTQATTISGDGNKFTDSTISYSGVSIGDTVISLHNRQTSPIVYRGVVTSVERDGVRVSPIWEDGITAGIGFSVIKTVPFNSKGTSLTTDLIGNPTNYPTIMKDRLAEGKGVFGVNPLLVSDTGVSLIGNQPIKYSKKALVIHNSPYSADTGTTWTGGTQVANYVSNLRNTGLNFPTDTHIGIESYTSQNNPYQATTPKAVASVEPKVIASNSHSIYKGAIVGNCIGKVQVGNGSNGYESKVLENVEICVDGFIIADGVTSNTVIIGKTYQIIGGLYNGEIWTRQISDFTGIFTTTFNYSSYSDEQTINLVYYTNRGALRIGTTPTHSPIALDNANSPAAKYFEGICYDSDYEYPFVVMEELAYNTSTSSYDGDDEKFTQLTNGVVTDLNGATCITKFMVGTPIGRRN